MYCWRQNHIFGKMLERNIGSSRLKIYFNVPPLQVWDVIGRSVVVAEGRDDLGLGGDLKSKVQKVTYGTWYSMYSSNL
jgi:hypothetical protein